MTTLRILAIALVALVLACDTATEPDPRAPARSLEPAASALNVADGELAFGPETFQRSTGQPATETRSFSTDGLGPPFTLRLQNGEPSGEKRVSSAEVVFDGAAVFGRSDFNQQVDLLSAVIEPAEEPSTLEVTLAGEPGSEVTVWIEHAGGQALLPVSSEGGTFEVSGGALELTVPEGAVSKPVTLTAEPPADEELPEGTTPAPGLVFDFGPDGTQFAEPVTLTFNYDEAALPAGTDEASLRAYTLVDGDWVEVEGSMVDVDANVLTVQVDHFSTYGSLPKGVTFCPAEGTDGSQAMRDAIAAVAPDGQVEICDGTHLAGDIRVGKPVTVTAQGPGRPAIDVGGANLGFFVEDMIAGPVIFRGFSMQNAFHSLLQVSLAYDHVLVDDMVLHAASPPDDPFSSGIFVFNATGNGVLIRGSDFLSGNVGVHTNGSDGVEVVDNDFLGQQNIAVTGPLARFNDNRVRLCPAGGCVAVSSGPAPAGPVEIAANHFTIDLTDDAQPGPVGTIVRASEGEVVFRDNVITGVGGTREPFDETTWPAHTAIEVSSVGNVIFQNNTITGVLEGISLGEAVGDVQGWSNWIHGVTFGLRDHFGVNTIGFHSSDFENYTVPLAGANLRAGWLTCNWWGSTLGPQGTPPDVDPHVYTPWAESAVREADPPVTTCEGALPPEVRVGTAAHDDGTMPVFETAEEALRHVAEGGTVHFSPDVHIVDDLDIARSVTLTGDRENTLIQTTEAASTSFLVTGGTVRITSMRFGGSSDPIIVSELGTEETGPYDRVEIDNLQIELTPGSSSGVMASPPVHPPDGRQIVVSNSHIIGGWRGLHVQDDVPDFQAIGNTMENQNEPGAIAIGYSRGASGRIEGNTLTGCPNCIDVGGGDRNTGTIEIVGNTVDLEATPEFSSAINASGLSLLIENNTVLGSGGARDPFDDTSWPVGTGLRVAETQSATVTGNAVTDAFTAYDVGEGTDQVLAEHNTADNVAVGLTKFVIGGNTVFNFNDFTNYDRALEVPNEGSAALACNWWGSVLGPHDANTPDPAIYTPWAESPIAATTRTTCDGGPPTQVRVDPATADGDDLTFPTVAGALAAVAPGGTILVADGPDHHFVHDLQIDRPVTIEAESGRPVIDGGGAAGGNSFMIENMDAGPVTFRGLQMQGAANTSIFISQAYDQVLVEDVHFFPEANPSEAFASGLFVIAATGNVVLVRHSTFEGGNVGVNTNGADGVELFDNDFMGQQNFAVNGPLARLQSNRFSLCPPSACVRINSGPAPPGPVEIRGNEFSIDLTDPAQPGPVDRVMHFQDGDFHVWENVVIGIGGTRVDFDDGTWPVRKAAISVDNTGFINIQDNAITGVFSGIDLGAAVGNVHGDGNWIHDVWVGLRDFTGVGSLGLHSSDFENYGIPMEGHNLQGGSLTCNWWGTAGGGPDPDKVPGDVEPDVYTPWAEASVKDADPPVTEC